MTAKITQPITGYSVVTDATAPTPAPPPPLGLTETTARPDSLLGSTYKVKTPLSDHALYITINDIILNPGTEHEQRRPFEIFINSKNMVHFQWIVALTRIISAVFRKGGEVAFLVDELGAIFDPQGGYFKRGGKYMPSLVAEIGDVIRQHLLGLGLIEVAGVSAEQRALIEEKKAAFTGDDDSDFPDSATLCRECQTKALIVMDGCEQCLNCGASKCN